MTIGGSIALIIIGAILRFAITWTPQYVNIQAMGVILMLGGVVVLAISLTLFFTRRRSQTEHSGHRAAPLPRAASLIGTRGPHLAIDPRPDGGRLRVHALAVVSYGSGHWVVVCSGRMATAIRSAASAGGPCGIP